MIDTVPAGRARTRTRVPAGAGGQLVGAATGDNGSGLGRGGGLTLPPRPVSQLDGRR